MRTLGNYLRTLGIYREIKIVLVVDGMDKITTSANKVETRDWTSTKKPMADWEDWEGLEVKPNECMGNIDVKPAEVLFV